MTQEWALSLVGPLHQAPVLRPGPEDGQCTGVCVCAHPLMCVCLVTVVCTRRYLSPLCAVLGRVHLCPGSGLYGTVLMCVHLPLTHACIRIKVQGRVSMYALISRLMPLCVPSGYRCGQKVSPSVLAFVHECVPVCPRSGMGPRADAAAWGKAGEGLASPCGLGETGLRAEGGDSPPLPRQRRRAPGSRGVLAGLRRLERRRRPAGRDQIHARTGTATTAAAGLSPRRSDGGRGVSATRRRPGAPRSGGGPAACCRW